MQCLRPLRGTTHAPLRGPSVEGQHGGCVVAYPHHLGVARQEWRYYCEAENKHGVDNSTTTNIDVTFAPQILPSSSCIRTADQINKFFQTRVMGTSLPKCRGDCLERLSISLLTLSSGSQWAAQA
ncbi:unnamed protein product [Oncorhynchus mykiss]|uniref:Uncharacterized protein n=1 Tax=Oncorhynchus mykiss TaxID=8022 RepID=A0A060W166_ONCMY|nr:unnamed protein product [Oncorhynchus mykiss]